MTSSLVEVIYSLNQYHKQFQTTCTKWITIIVDILEKTRKACFGYLWKLNKEKEDIPLIQLQII